MPRPAPRWRFGEPLAPLAALLARGGIAAIPTESSYGLAALPDSRAGVEAVYRVKERERARALPVVVAGVDQLTALGLDPTHPLLAAAAAFWPGALTVVLPLSVARLPAAAGGDTLAVRVPGHAGLRQLLAALGRGLTATSANLSGGEPILDPEEAARLLAGEPLALVVDGGALPGGPPSTLVAPAPGRRGGAAVRVLRAGRVPIEALRAHLEVVE